MAISQADFFILYCNCNRLLFILMYVYFIALQAISYKQLSLFVFFHFFYLWLMSSKENVLYLTVAVLGQNVMYIFKNNITFSSQPYFCIKMPIALTPLMLKVFLVFYNLL
jgi:hypothetical protein